MNKPQVIAKVVDNDLCTGCGVCIYSCSSNALTMDWNKEGFLVPKLTGDCNNDSSCISVCPFNPEPIEAVKNETTIADIFLSEGTKTYDKLGRLIDIYASYSNEFRETSTSGGLATYVLDQLLKRGVVDHIFSVKLSANDSSHYQYIVSSSEEDLRKTSKTRYFPVTLANVLPKLNELEGKVAIIGVPCFVKAIRLAQYQDPYLKEKIPFVAGIICGGMKSKFFTEYLASEVDVNITNIDSPEYRIENINSNAGDYSFGCVDKSTDENKFIKMVSLGDMWGTGLFKANACDFCEDIVAELADITFGDAWIQPYKEDSRGTNVVITRSPLADSIMQDGINNSELFLEKISPESMVASQQSSYYHRHDALSVRLEEARKKGINISDKRYGNKSVSIDVIAVQKLRRITRKSSLKIWQKNKSAKVFNKKIKNILFYLKIATLVTHKKRKTIQRLKKLK